MAWGAVAASFLAECQAVPAAPPADLQAEAVVRLERLQPLLQQHR